MKADTEKKVSQYTEVQIRQINYTIIEKLWESIANIGEKKSKAVFYRANEKDELYKSLGTYPTDFSSYKTGKKKTLTKRMKAAIEIVNYRCYKDKNEIIDDIIIWESILKKVLLGTHEVKLKDISNDDILELYGTKLDKKQKQEIRSQLEKCCEQMVLKYWEKVNTKSLIDAICIWLSIIIAGDYSAYIGQEKIKSAGTVLADISFDNLARCNTLILEDNIKKIEKALEKMKTVYNYKILEEKSKKSK